MKKRAAMLLLLGLGLGAWAWMNVQGQQPTTQDEQAIRKTVESYAVAFEKGDLDAVMALYAPDAEFIDPAGKTTKGRAAIAALFKKELANLKGFKIKFHVTSIKLFKSEVALEDGISELIAPDGTSRKSRYNAVWVKTDGKWLISQARDFTEDGDAGESSTHARLKELEWLVGDWVTGDKEAVSTLSCRWTLNRHFLQLEFGLARKETPAGEVTQLVGWDPLSGKIKSWFFDARGGYGEALWVRQGNTWKNSVLGVLPDGRKASGTYSIKFLNEKSFVLQLNDREVDGLPLADVELKYVRKGTNP